MGPSSSTAIEVREPAADIRAQVEKHKPARRVTTKKSRIAVFKNSEDDADDDDEDEGDDSLPKRKWIPVLLEIFNKEKPKNSEVYLLKIQWYIC